MAVSLASGALSSLWCGVLCLRGLSPALEKRPQAGNERPFPCSPEGGAVAQVLASLPALRLGWSPHPPPSRLSHEPRHCILCPRVVGALLLPASLASPPGARDTWALSSCLGPPGVSSPPLGSREWETCRVVGDRNPVELAPLPCLVLQSQGLCCCPGGAGRWSRGRLCGWRNGMTGPLPPLQ